MAEHDDDGYRVGYKKPPIEHRFQKGQKSRGGRPKGSTSGSVVDRVLGKKIGLTIDGKKTNVPLDEAILVKRATDALQGDREAGREMIRLIGSREKLKGACTAQAPAAKVLPPLPLVRFSTYQNRALRYLGVLVDGAGNSTDKVASWLAMLALSKIPDEAWNDDDLRKMIFQLEDPMAVVELVPDRYRLEWVEQAERIARDQGLMSR